MRVKVSEASGVVLDYLVAKCEDLHTGIDGFWTTAVLEQEENPFRYSTDWALGGPIIESIDIARFNTYPDWEATMNETDNNPFATAVGPTPLIAAMRCYVVSKLGEEVEIPDELA